MNDTTDKGGFLSNKQYDFVKFLTVTLLPAVGTLYFALATTWGLPAGEQVCGTLLAIQVFIAAVMHISTTQYVKSDARFDGAIVTEKTAAGNFTRASLEFDQHPEDILKKDEVLLKVK